LLAAWQVIYKQLMQELLQSTFCFVLPGDTASSRRLSDIMLAGCIPVFLGKPWHSMPFAEDLPYADFALFFQLDAFLKDSVMCACCHLLSVSPPTPSKNGKGSCDVGAPAGSSTGETLTSTKASFRASSPPPQKTRTGKPHCSTAQHACEHPLRISTIHALGPQVDQP
jgi:hypothetical protein